MITQAADPVFSAVEDLQTMLTGHVSGSTAWRDDFHLALGRVAAAIQQDVQAAEQEVKHIGSVNEDFKDAPVTQRRVEATRADLIELGERIHQLRADTRAGNSVDELRRRGDDLVKRLEAVRHAKNEILLETLNSNPGAGE